METDTHWIYVSHLVNNSNCLMSCHSSSLWYVLLDSPDCIGMCLCAYVFGIRYHIHDYIIIADLFDLFATIRAIEIPGQSVLCLDVILLLL